MHDSGYYFLTYDKWLSDVKKIAESNIFQSFGFNHHEFYDHYQHLFTKEEKLNILWYIWSMEEQEEICPYLMDYVDEFKEFGCWVEDPSELTLGCVNQKEYKK